MVLWGDLKAQVRQTVLADRVEPSTPKWADSTLAYICQWALADFCSHTARPVEMRFDSSVLNPSTSQNYDMTSDKVFTLTEQPYEGLELSGVVYVVNGGTVKRIDPARGLIDGLSGFYTFPANKLHLPGSPGSSTAVLVVRYYSTYPTPALDTDTIDIPDWAIPAICYRMGAHALSMTSMKTSSIRQYATREDSGTPEDNPIREQLRLYNQMYASILASHPAQDRTAHNE